MNLRSTALALAATGALLLPTAAEAGHRHSRSCGHGSYRSDYRYDRYDHGRYYGRSRGYAYGYYRPRPVYRYYAPPVYYAPPPAYYYDDYGYGYGPGYGYRRAPAVSLHYHSGRACSRFHVGLNLRF
jgi:hypothetical protein